MQNIKIIVEYDGTDFYGWQVQPGKRTVQGELEKALKTIFNKRIRITGSGRTDAGVHALGQVASFTAPSKIPPKELKSAINGNIPKDILVKQCSKAPEDFNARFSAVSRIYRYQIAKEKSVFNQRYFLLIEEELNTKEMKKAGQELLGKKDFAQLATKDSGICLLKRLKIAEDKNNILIDVEADRFLRRMARGIVGLLVNAGKEKLTAPDVKNILSGKKRRPPVAPPQGLFLVKVKY